MHILSLALLFLAAQRPEAAAQQATTPVLVVNGNSEVLAIPDQALVRLGIVRQAAVAQTAQEEVNSVAQEMADALHVNLAEVIEASEGGVSVIPKMQTSLSVAGAAAASTPVSPGEI